MINDTETVEWFNLMLSRFWLIFEPMISEIVIGSVNPILEYYTPSFLVPTGAYIPCHLVLFF